MPDPEPNAEVAGRLGFRIACAEHDVTNALTVIFSDERHELWKLACKNLTNDELLDMIRIHRGKKRLRLLAEARRRGMEVRDNA